MIGIKNVGIYIPRRRISNVEKAEVHGVTMQFIEKKIGITSTSRKKDSERASDMCVSAFKNLQSEETELDHNQIDFMCVCTQNCDYQLPQTSAVVHAKLNFATKCAAFDISLGCSGYPYSLLIAKTFMEANGMEKGLLFTSDPYSEIIDPNDKNTDLLFGDGAAVTLLTKDPILHIARGVFGTHGSNYKYLIKQKNEKLQMNGRGIFNFVMKYVPGNLQKCLNLNGLKRDDVDLFLFHQASKYIIDNLICYMKLDKNKVPFKIEDFGNTVSSTLPIMLKDYLKEQEIQNIFISGFGVGLSVSSLILRRI